MKKKLRFIVALGTVFLLVVVTAAAWFIHGLNEATKLDVWERDGPPSSDSMIGILGADYPKFITRVVENGISSRFNGDGEQLTVFCFPASKVLEMKQLLGKGGDWISGVPQGPNWRRQIELRSTPDLQIPANASKDDFVHLELGAWSWTIIDTVRGICYRGVIRT